MKSEESSWQSRTHNEMFTGIVEHIGEVCEFIEVDSSWNGGNGVSITIKNSAKILSDCHIGDSISVNGTCLTVTEFNEDSFKVGLIPETLKRTNLGELKPGDLVNLERAVGGDVRFGGHYVQGHVDTTATIVDIVKENNALNFTFELRDQSFINYIVEKGFIAVDGISLTVTFVSDTSFGISMISHTQENVTLSKKQVGQQVNIEVDLTGKLIEKQVNLQLSNQLSNPESAIVKLIEKAVAAKVAQSLSS